MPFVKLSHNQLFPVDDGDLTCQAGARWEDINRILKERGTSLFFPVSQSIRLINQINHAIR